MKLKICQTCNIKKKEKGLGIPIFPMETESQKNIDIWDQSLHDPNQFKNTCRSSTSPSCVSSIDLTQHVSYNYSGHIHPQCSWAKQAMTWFKGTVSIISSDLSLIERHAQFTTVPFKALFGKLWGRYPHLQS